jgi:hypothetical protein
MPSPDPTVDFPEGTREPEAATLVRVLDAYLADLQAGRHPDRAELLAEYPGLADELASCLAGLEFIHNAASKGPDSPARLGDFRIVREVGRGGMGVVYEAEQLSLRRRVALKVLRYGPAADAEAMERFRREAETVAHLHHTNIVPIFALGEEAGVRYYAMQFIEGRSLADSLDASRRERRPLAPSDVAAWGLQAAEALGYAHRRGVIHRDIKPSNLLLDPEGLVWLTDFGLAKRIDEAALTVTGALLGTPRYMSPEQAAALGRPIDARTDIYSLGATLYELATGRPLFEADSPHAILARIITTEPIRPRVARPDLPRDLETILLKCLAKDPAARYPNAAALADDLRAFLDGRPIRARRVSPFRLAARWAKRHRKTAAVASGSAAVVVGLFALGNLWRSVNVGSVRLRTGEPGLTAEIRDAETGDVVQPEFSLPTRQPLTMPPGAYHVEVVADGRPTESYRLDVARGQATDHLIRPDDRRPFEPFAIGPGDLAETIGLGDGGEDVIHAQNGLIRRIDGFSGRTVWALGRAPGPDGSIAWRNPAGVADDDSETGRRIDQWIARLLFPTERDNPPALLRPAPDLDGDGVGDLVFGLRLDGRLWAISGRGEDGRTRVLWQVDQKDGAVVGDLQSDDLDGDGTPDVLAAFDGASARWVAAFSGRSGEALWRCDLDPTWFGAPTSQATHFLPHVRLVRDGDALAAIVGAGHRLARLDPRTGEILKTLELDGGVAMAPKAADLDGDGRPELVVVREGVNIGDDALLAVGLDLGEPRWRRPFEFRWGGMSNAWPPDGSWPLAEDLDGDGACELVVPIVHRPAGPPGSSSAWVGVEVVRGRDGFARWRHPLASANFNPGRPDSFLAGPDLDGDGVREVFMASVAGRYSGRDRAGIYVDALSGHDGHSLWWRRRLAPGWDEGVGPLAWWGHGPDGWPRLVVPCETRNRRPALAVVLSAASGQPEFVIPSAALPRVGDLNNDGIPDLAYRVQPSDGRDAFAATLGGAPVLWRRLGDSRPAPDLDGDGAPDLVESRPGSVAAVSGLDGRTLWRADNPPEPVGGGGSTWEPIPSLDSSALDPNAPPSADLDGDGADDLLLGVTQGLGRFGTRPEDVAIPIRALSGRTGRTLWEVPPLRIHGLASNDGAAPMFARFPDLDGDGAPEVLAVVRGDRFGVSERVLPSSGPVTFVTDKQLFLIWISGRDGRILRRQTLGVNNPQGVSHTLDQYREPPVVADLDGDGRPEVLATAIITESDGTLTPELRAYAGLAEGPPLWTYRLANLGGFRGTTLDLPDPLVGDLDGDGRPEVVVADAVDPAHPEAPGDNVAVVALSGRDGRPIWERPWRTRDDRLPEILRPAATLARGPDGRAGIVVRTSRGKPGESRPSDPGASVLTRLDARGQVVGTRELDARGGQRRPNDFRAADLDGDGADELLVLSGSWQDAHLAAVRGDLGGVAWEWSGLAASLLGVRPAGPGRPTEVVLARADDSAVALSGLDGRALWRAVGGAFVAFNARPPDARLVPPATPGGPPRVVARRLDVTTSLAVQPLPTPGPGRPSPDAVAAARPAIPDPRVVRPLPWAAYDLGPDALGLLAGSVAGAAILAALALGVAPRLRRPRVRLASALLVPAAAALAFAAARTWGPAALGQAAALALLGLPTVAFLGAAAHALARRRWRRLGGLVALWAVAAPAVAALQLRAAPPLEPWQSYRPDGWPLVLLPAAYATGLVLLAALSIRALVRGLLRLSSPRPRSAGGVAPEA